MARSISRSPPVPSNSRSTASDATAAVKRTRGSARDTANARANSPPRHGITLFTIIPPPVLRQRGGGGTGGGGRGGGGGGGRGRGARPPATPGASPRPSAPTTGEARSGRGR